MKLAAIFIVWDDWDLLELSLQNIRPLVDDVFIISSALSNYGERSLIPAHVERKNNNIFDPDLNFQPNTNERAKRNFGLQKARELGYTHFIMLDADEFYEPEAFLKERTRIEREDLTGTVCRLKTYFKSPTLTIGLDTTLVPFIHKITPELKFEWNRAYPYAWEGKNIRIDPTRQLNITSGVEMSEIIMHHFSWIRSDIRKKIRNSTARQNIERSTIVKDYLNAKEGYFCEFYQKTLVACENLFNIPDIIDKNVS